VVVYSLKDKFLYEILDDYRETTCNITKREIIDGFFKLVWGSINKRLTYVKYLSFDVNPELINSNLGVIFFEYSSVPYIAYKSMTTNKQYIDLIRQKINNLYTNMCDSEVCIKKNYMDLLNTPKRLYYRWQGGFEKYDPDELKQLFSDSILQAQELKTKYGKQKMNISWSEYKKLIEGFFVKIFNNYVPLEEYEDKSKIVLNIDIWTEDNFIISYFSKSLNGYMKDYQKEYYNIKKCRNIKLERCVCGKLFEQTNGKRKVCPDCAEVIHKNQKRDWDRNNR